ncbi:MAG: LON peptidase substrate-binding domain-containing protein [Sandaracinaceae bacterium]|nr:LON peptidase substrate-binding domain-containing protein [Sandaracinaceae bacterium]
MAVGVQKDPNVSEPSLDDLHPVGVLARVRQKTERGDRGILLLVEGLVRLRPVELVGREPFLRVRAEPVAELHGDTAEASPARRVAAPPAPRRARRVGSGLLADARADHRARSPRGSPRGVDRRSARGPPRDPARSSTSRGACAR